MATTLPLTTRMDAIVKRAVAIGGERGHHYLGTEHVLLALLEDPDGIAGGVIRRLGFAQAVRTEVERARPPSMKSARTALSADA